MNSNHLYLVLFVSLFSIQVYAECAQHNTETLSGVFKVEKDAPAFSRCSNNEEMKRVLPVKISEEGCVVEFSLSKKYSGSSSNMWTSKNGLYRVYSSGALCGKSVGEKIDLKLTSDGECCRVKDSWTMTGGPACNIKEKKWIKQPSERFVRCMSGGVWNVEVIKSSYLKKDL